MDEQIEPQPQSPFTIAEMMEGNRKLYEDIKDNTDPVRYDGRVPCGCLIGQVAERKRRELDDPEMLGLRSRVFGFYGYVPGRVADAAVAFHADPDRLDELYMAVTDRPYYNDLWAAIALAEEILLAPYQEV